MSLYKVSLVIIVFLLSGCSNLQDLHNIEVELVNIQPIKSVGSSPRFNLQLLIANPNPQNIGIESVSFKLEIAGQNILSGMSDNIPTLMAYSQTNIQVQAKLNLFSLYALLTHLSQLPNEKPKYKLHAELRPKGFFTFSINKQGYLTRNILQALLNQSQ